MTPTTGKVAMTAGDELPTIYFSSRGEWGAWLEENHETVDGVWLKIAKKDSGVAGVSYPEAVEVALCYGWIDGLARKFDDKFWLQRYTPRRTRSKWSKINRDKATKLIEEGAMKPAGLREVERAKSDGRWDAAYESPSKATVPEDLRLELERNDAARKFFSTLDGANRYAILHRIQDAKRPETRARRIEKYVAMLAEGEKIHL